MTRGAALDIAGRVPKEMLFADGMPDVPLEKYEELCTQAIALLGRRNSGKTYGLGRLCEVFYEMGCPFVALDPVGNMWGLRVAADGKSQGLDIPVLGGLHGDIPITAEGGAVVADFVSRIDTSVVIDVSMFDDDERVKFAAAFARRFYAHAKKQRKVRMLLLEEAQLFIPEQPQEKGDKAMRNAFRPIVRIGRNFGLGCVMATQRPQSVDKETFNQAELLIVGQMSGSHERGAVKRWISTKGEDQLAAQLSELPALETGTFFAWSPSWLRFFAKIKIRPKWTYDASETPKLRRKKGIVDPATPPLSPADLERLRKALSAAKATADDSDIEVLRKRVREAESALAEARRTAHDLAQKQGESAGSAEAEARLKAALEKLLTVRAKLLGFGQGVKDALEDIVKVLDSIEVRPGETAARHGARLGADTTVTDLVRRPVSASVREGTGATASRRLPEEVPRRSAAAERQVATSRYHELSAAAPSEPERTDGLQRREMVVLRTLVSAAYVGQTPMTVDTLAAWTSRLYPPGYTAKSSSMDKSLAELRRRGVISGTSSGIEPSPVGMKLVAREIGMERLDWWMPRLGKREREVLKVYAERVGKGTTREQVSARTGYGIDSSSLDKALAWLKRAGLIERVGNDPGGALCYAVSNWVV